MLSDRFVEAVHAGDRQALGAAMAPGVEFRSPVVFKPYASREVVELILAEGAMKVFEDSTRWPRRWAVALPRSG